MAVETHKALGRTCLESVDLAVVGGSSLGCASEQARTLGDLVRRIGAGAAGRPVNGTLASMAILAVEQVGCSGEAQWAQIAAMLEWPIYPVAPKASGA